MDRLPSDKTLTELAEWMADGQFGSDRHAQGNAEFFRRQVEWQIKAAEAQIEAANSEAEAARAATETAAATRLNAKYLLASVIVAAVAAIFSAVSTFLTWYGVTHSLHL